VDGSRELMRAEETLLLAEGSTPVEHIENGRPCVKLSQLVEDFYQSARHKGFWLYSSWIEILLSYRSTLLGPLWILIGTGVFVFAIGGLYGRVILSGGSNVYLAHLAIGITVWYFITQTAIGSCHLFRSFRGDILDGDNSYTDLILKLITTNLIYLLHNSVIVVIALLFAEVKLSMVALLLLITAPLVILNIIWVCVILSILGARYPDLQELMRSSLRLMFFITPILWIPHQHIRGGVIDAVLYLNPFYYFVEVIQAPLIYGQVPYFEIAVLTAALPIGWLAASLLYARTRPWVALWL
jgi:homopolymeric O-antigen transport system permease protein